MRTAPKTAWSNSSSASVSHEHISFLFLFTDEKGVTCTTVFKWLLSSDCFHKALYVLVSLCPLAVSRTRDVLKKARTNLEVSPSCYTFTLAAIHTQHLTSQALKVSRAVTYKAKKTNIRTCGSDHFRSPSPSSEREEPLLMNHRLHFFSPCDSLVRTHWCDEWCFHSAEQLWVWWSWMSDVSLKRGRRKKDRRRRKILFVPNTSH